MSIYWGKVGACLWCHHHAESSDDVWEQFLLEAKRFHKLMSARAHCVFTITWKAAPPNAKQRKAIADILVSTESFAAHALVTDSRAIKMVLTAIDWLVTKSYSEKVFVDAAAALDWLNERCPIDRAEILQAVLSNVPAAEHDAALGFLYSQYARGA